MSLCVIAAGVPENLLALAVGLVCLGLGFAGTHLSRIVVVSARRTLRSVALAGAVYAVGDAAAPWIASYAESLRDSVFASMDVLKRVFAVQLDPPTQ